MVDSQPMEEEFQGAVTRDIGTETHREPTIRRLDLHTYERARFVMNVAEGKLAVVWLVMVVWVWTLESSGEFSVRSARSYIDDALFPTVGAPTRWVSVVPIKINVFAWRVSLDRLPTRINLSLRGIDIPSILCPICSCAGESSSHLLFSCNVAHLLLLKVARWWELDIQECMSYADWLSWFNALRLSKGIKRVLEGVFYVMWWSVTQFTFEGIAGFQGIDDTD
ncbi:RNA-directed DNA polymerase, eukaryota [Tanacetum coccineum]